MMKKIFAVLLVCAMFLPILASCGSMQAGELDVTAYDAEGNYENVGYVTTTGGVDLRTELSSASEYTGTLTVDDYKWYLDFDNVVETSSTETPIYDTDGVTVVSYETTRTYTVTRKAASSQEDGLDVYTITTANEFAAFFLIRSPDSISFTSDETKDGLPNKVTATYSMADGNVNYFTGVKVKLASDIVINKLKSGVVSPTKKGDFSTTYTLKTHGSSSIFKGVFDGCGHVISGIYSECGSGGEKGLFGCVNGDSAKLTNFSLINTVLVTPTGSGKKHVGVLFSKLLSGAEVEISNVYVDAYMREPGTPQKVTSVGAFVGWVDGSSSVSLDNCVFAGTVNLPLSQRVAGFVGDATTGSVSIDHCSNLGDVIANAYVGGFVGYSTTGLTIKNSTNAGDITAFGSNVSGFVGAVSANTDTDIVSFDKCKNFGTICTNHKQVGGFIGYFKGAKLWITNSESSCNIDIDVSTGDSTHVGGFAGYVVGAADALIKEVKIENCKFTGSLTADRSSGGIVGYIQHCADSTIKNCVVAAELTFNKVNTGNQFNGGIAGQFCEDGAVLVENCTVTGSITLSDYNKQVNYAGGLVGCLRNNENSAYYTDGTTYTFKNCTVDAKFVKNINSSNKEPSGANPNDVVNPIYGLHDTQAKCTVVWENIQLVPDSGYDAQDAETSNVSVIGANLIQLAERKTTVTAIGSQFKQNTDGTYSFRYVFGVKDIYALDSAIGFNVAIDRDDGTGMTTKEMTVYCTEIYSSITDSEGNTYAASEKGVDHLFTLVIDNVPASEIALVVDGSNKQAYLRNAKVRLVGFVGANGRVTKQQTIDYCKSENTLKIELADMSATLPQTFANAYQGSAAGEIPAINFNEGLDSSTTSKEAGCYKVYRMGATQVYIHKTCTVEGHACTYVDSTGEYSLNMNGICAYKTSTNENGRYHFYGESNQWGVKTLTPAPEKRYDYYYSVKVNVDEAGVYDFCFRIRMQNTATTREIQIQINDQAYCDQTNLYFKTTAKPADKIASETGSDATHLDSYLTGFSAKLKAGENIITFRAPDSGSQMHIRDFYIVKSSVDEISEDNIHTFVPSDYHNDLPAAFGTTTKAFQMNGENYVTDSNGRLVTITDNLNPGVIKIDGGSFVTNTALRIGAFYYTWEDTGAASGHGARYLASNDNRSILHYYLDAGNANGKLSASDPKITTTKDAYMRWEFTVEEAGVYDVCFNIRASATDKRYALIQIDNAPISESYILTWELEKDSEGKYIYTDEMRDTFVKGDENNMGTNGSYLTGFSLELTAGKHTITFRIPYKADGTAYGGTNSWHFRNIYLLKKESVEITSSTGSAYTFSNSLDSAFEAADAIKIAAADHLSTDTGVSDAERVKDSGIRHYYTNGTADTDSITLKFVVPQDGTYNVCLGLALKREAQTRGNYLQIDGGEKILIDYTVTGAQAYSVTDDGYGTYVTGLDAVELTAGEHTFKITNASGFSKTIHFRNIYLVKVAD